MCQTYFECVWLLYVSDICFYCSWIYCWCQMMSDIFVCVGYEFIFDSDTLLMFVVDLLFLSYILVLLNFIFDSNICFVGHVFTVDVKSVFHWSWIYCWCQISVFVGHRLNLESYICWCPSWFTVWVRYLFFVDRRPMGIQISVNYLYFLLVKILSVHCCG